MDASHDLRHTLRVWRLAAAVAEGESLPPRGVALARVAALLHDVGDEKYGGGAREKVSAILRALPPALALPADDVSALLAVVAGVSFKAELARVEAGAAASTGGGGGDGEGALIARVTACVQDADRLDALGALGVARAFTYGGARGRPLYAASDLDAAARRDVVAREAVSVADYERLSETTIGHASVKLLRLARMLKTATGRALGAARHATMQRFIDAFFAELGPEALVDEALADEAAAATTAAVAALDSGGARASAPVTAPAPAPAQVPAPAPAPMPAPSDADAPAAAAPKGDAATSGQVE
jgi:uncharacterized protein